MDLVEGWMEKVRVEVDGPTEQDDTQTSALGLEVIAFE